MYLDELKILIDSYTDDLKVMGHKAEGEGFRPCLYTFLDFLRERPYITSVSDICRGDMEDYIEYINEVPYETKKGGYRPSFVYRRLRALDHFLDHLTLIQEELPEEMIPRAGLLEYSDFPAPNKRGVKHFPEWFDKYIHQKILDLPKSIRTIKFRTMMLFIYHTGARSLDMCTVELNALHQRGDRYWVRIYSNKLKKEYEIPVVDELANAIEEYKEVKNKEIQKRVKQKHPTSGKKVIYLFTNNGTPECFKNSFGQKLKHFTEEVLLSAEAEGHDVSELRDMGLTSHKFRHNVGIKLVRMGADPLLVAEFLGHGDLSMAQAYIQEDWDYINSVCEEIETDEDSIIEPIIIKKSELMQTGDVVSKTTVGWCAHINGVTPCGEDPYKCWRCEKLEPKEGEEYYEYLKDQQEIHSELYNRNVELGFEAAAEAEREVLDRIEQFMMEISGQSVNS